MRIRLNSLQLRRVARNLQWEGGRGLFRRLETTSNDLDPDFDRPSLRLRRFFCPNFGDLEKKSSTFNRAEAQFFWSKSLQVLD